MPTTSKILSFFPNVRGVGYSFFKGQEYQYSGMLTARNRFSNESYLRRIKEIIDKQLVDVVVLEEYRKNYGSIKTERIRKMLSDIALFARSKNIKVVTYKRKDIRDVFSFYNAMNKYDIAKLLCIWIPSLTQHMYKRRSPHKMEPYSSAIFDAISLSVTFVYLS